MDVYSHGESIYNIIPKKQIQEEKPPRYASKHASKLPPTATTFGGAQTSHPACMNIAGDANDMIVPNKSGRTFGKAPGTLRNDPTDYMKKNANTSKVATLSEVKKDKPNLLQPTELKAKLKPDVPKKSDMPVMNLVTSKNFVVANAVETILAAPKRVSQDAKDYLQKEDFGKVPKYLKHIKQDIEDEYDYIRRLQEEEEEARNSQVRPMSEDERLALIAGLKQKWETINTEFQAYTHLTKLDTFGKIKRKEKHEAELAQIEKDLERLNRKSIIIDTRC
jgi:hypothetical protein